MRDDITLVFDNLQNIPVGTALFHSLVQCMGPALENLGGRLKVFILPAWRSLLPAWRTRQMRWSPSMRRALVLFHLHEDGMDYPSRLLESCAAQTREVHRLIPDKSEWELQRFLTDSHGDIPPLEQLEAVNLILHKKRENFIGMEDPLAGPLARFRKTQLAERHPEVDRTLSRLRPGTEEPVPWQEFFRDFQDRNKFSLPEVLLLQNSLQRVLETGALCRRPPRDETRGREYLVCAAVRKAWKLVRTSEDPDGGRASHQRWAGKAKNV